MKFLCFLKLNRSRDSDVVPKIRNHRCYCARGLSSSTLHVKFHARYTRNRSFSPLPLPPSVVGRRQPSFFLFWSSMVHHGSPPRETAAIPRRRARSRQLRKTYLFAADGHTGETREQRRIMPLCFSRGNRETSATFLRCDDASTLQRAGSGWVNRRFCSFRARARAHTSASSIFESVKFP